MPTQQEKVAQIEAALRRRVFAHVPKVVTPDRTNWSEDQHDTDRLSRALAAYALVGLAGLDDATAAATVTDGKDDGGIDSLYYSRDQQRLYILQAKFKRTGVAPSQDENLKTINGVKALLSRRFDEFNPRGIEAARQRGKHLGRPMLLTAEHAEKAIERLRSNDTLAMLAGEWRVSERTISRLVKRHVGEGASPLLPGGKGKPKRRGRIQTME